jgi:histone H3/H4
MSVSNHQPEYDEDELQGLSIEPELPPPPLSSKGKDKKKTKKSTTKRKERKEEPQPDVEEEQEGEKEQAVEEEEEEEPVVEPAPAPKKQRKTFAEHKLKGDRLALMPNYRRKLEKNRARNKQKLGDEHERKKLQAGTVSRLESNYLQHANGLLLPYAIVRRVVIQESAGIIEELQRINSRVELRLRERGKEPPATLTIKDAKQWHFSDNAVELVRAAVQAKLETVSEAASDMRRKTGRVTVMDTDVTDAIRFIQTYGTK